MSGPRDLRASDADREQAVAALQRHHDAGRLDPEELEERVGTVLASRTLAEIDAAFPDLPTEVPTSAPVGTTGGAIVPVGSPRVGLPGKRPFTYAAVVPGERERVAARFLQHVGPALRAAGYTASPPTADGFVFVATRIPRWAIAATVFVPVPGVLALVFAERERIEVRVDLEDAGPGRTRMTVHGAAPRGLRRAFAQLVS